MKNLTHEAVGGAVTLAACAATSSGPLIAAGALCASLLGSRLPDVDQLGARIHRRTRLERRSVTAAAIGWIARLPMTLFALVARHRGATHWLTTAVATSAVCAAAAAAVWVNLALPVGVGVGCGYCAHLIADACTPHGAPLLGPFNRQCVHLLPHGHRIRTGGRADLLVLLVAGVAAVALGALMLQNA